LKKYGLNELREMFLAFFEEKGHLRLPSFPLIPRSDASLLLINSGMAPMKPWFTGEQEPPRKRVCTCQKCIRTNDIDNVGKTSRHGSYFEMLGNFSFGDYFKTEAITWCWEFLTQRLGMDPSLLYPSVYTEDDQAFDIWTNVVGVAPERVSRLGRDDNFWDHGSGPCGPCSEVYFDRGEENGCGSPDCAPGCDCDRYVEIWNNVFTQFDNDGSGNYSELSQKNIDTGMGLERLACVCQGVGSMFEVDTIIRIIKKVSEISGVAYGEGTKTDVSIRVITDHIRAATMMICDGVLPSNERRGYVLRRLLRRAARHGRLLGLSGMFLWDVCGAVIDENIGAYPDLSEKSGFIARVIRSEEECFGKTIDVGAEILSGLIEQYKVRGETTLSGADAFKLYDTYGFPLDLTIEILAENNMDADTTSFEALMEEQRAQARKARAALGDLAWAGIDLGLDNTPTTFTGYENTRDTGEILAIVSDGELCLTTQIGREAPQRPGGQDATGPVTRPASKPIETTEPVARDRDIIVLDKTPFYAEMGGQSSDFGVIALGDAIFEVDGAKASKGGKVLHYGAMRSGSLSVGDTVTAEIDVARRHAIMRAHSATHLLHEALREVLGEHVRQAGSLVEPDKLRFDFTHFSALTRDELDEIELRVNTAILNGFQITTGVMPIHEANKLGAMALFGEKYGDLVRVVKMGGSIELCGGTHLENTAKAGAFSIISEFSVAAGVRRIEALTGMATLESLSAARRQLGELSGMLKAGAPEELRGKIEQQALTMRELRSKLDAATAKQAIVEARQMLDCARDLKGLKVIATVIDDVDADAGADKLRQISDMLREWETSVVALLAFIKDDKVTLMAACGKKAVEKGAKAGELVREAAKLCGGSGGGKADFAMGGGKDVSKLNQALEAAIEYVMNRTGE